MSTRKTNPDFQNGVPELLILKLLSHEEMYGYQLVRAIVEATGQALAYGEGSIYPVLHGLEARKLLRARQEIANGRVRSYYRITQAGRKRFEELASTFEKTVGAVRLVLEGANVSG